MSEKNYKIVINSDLEDFIPNLFNDYWSFLDFNNLKYRYTSSSIQEKYGLAASVYYKAVRSSGYLEFKELMDCGKCYANIKIYNRNEIFQLIKKRSHSELFCKKCFSAEFNNICKLLVKEFSDQLPLEVSAEKSMPLQDLSYLEKIFLYTLLTQASCENEVYIDEYVWNNFQALEAVGMEELIESIFNKKYIYIRKYDCKLLETQEKIREINRRYSNYLDSDIGKDIDCILDVDLSANLFINIPSEYNDLASWVRSLYHQITSSALSLTDCKEIEHFVKTKRLMEVYDLLDSVCQKNVIPVNKDNALELELLRMTSNYGLNYCYSILSYQASKTASVLHVMSSSCTPNYNFIKVHIYRKKISSFLDHLESKDENPKYPKALPVEWSTSEIELFVSMHIIKNYQKWEKFTPNEIIESWLSVLEVEH